MTAHNKKESRPRPTPQPKPHKQDGLDPSRAPEEEGSATQTKQKGNLLREHKTDESGAPVD